MLTYPVFSEKSLNLCRYLTIIAAIAAPISTAVTSVAMTAILLIWLISGQALQTLKISYQQPLGKMVLLFIAWLFIGALYADTDWHQKITTLLSWKKLFVVFILLGFFTQDFWKRRFVQSFLVVMFIAAIVAAISWACGWELKPGQNPGIIMTNNSAQSTALIAATLCGLFMLQEPLSTVQKRWTGAAIALFLFDIFFVGTSRSPYLAATVAMIFATITIYGHKKAPHIIGIALLGLILIGFSSTRLQERIKLALNEHATYQTSDHDTSIGIRVILFENTVELIKKRPVFGYGTSSFEKAYGEQVTGKYNDWRGKVGPDPHNQYLFVWLENGLIGLILFAGYIFVAIRQGLSNRPYGAIAASFLVAICTSSLFNSHFKTFPEGFLLAFLMGALLARPPAAPSNETSHA